MDQPVAVALRAHACWEHFAHEADISVPGRGASPETAFEQTALGPTAVVADPILLRNDEQVAIHCEAPSLELLFVDWLNALIYEMTTRSMLFGRFRVTIDGDRRRLFIHRKGPTRAFGPGHPELPGELRDIGQPVLIGGSVGTESWVLVGAAAR